MTNAYEEGIDAYTEKHFEDNPYRESTQEYTDWRDGYLDAQDIDWGRDD